MKNVYIEYIGLPHEENGIVESLFALSSKKKYLVVSTPDSADFILLVKLKGYGPYFNVLMNRNIIKYPNKCFIISSGDLPLYFIKGIYSSHIKDYNNPSWSRSFHYIHGPKNQYLTDDLILGPTKYLFSFTGNSKTHYIREEILRLNHPLGHLEDTSGSVDRMKRLPEDEQPKAWEKYREDYAKSVCSAKFVLCPRGFGTSSFRIFEAMRCGRVPVIISDDWVPPLGPEWNKCSIRIRESEVGSIINKLESEEDNFDLMSYEARISWEKYFSPEASAKYMMSLIESIHAYGKNWSKYQFWSLLDSFRFKHLKGFFKENILKWT